jgi:hypothetical protein
MLSFVCFTKLCLFKEIVSRDSGGLLMFFWTDLKFKVFPDHIYSIYNLKFICHIELFKNDTRPGALQACISLRSRIFYGTHCPSEVLELRRSSSTLAA